MSSGWRAYQLIPDDVLFFRDGRPAAMGQDHYHRSMFPPAPSTVYGAIRNRRLVDFGVDVGARFNEPAWEALPDGARAEVGEWGCFGSLEIRGPWIVADGEPLVPVPADIGITIGAAASPGAMQFPSQAIRDVFRMRFDVSREGGHSHALRCGYYATQNGGAWVDAEDKDVERAEGWFLTPDGLASWQQGHAPEARTFRHSSELWRDETRTGVGLDKDVRRHAEHMLFTLGFVRLRPGVALGFEARGTGLEPDGAVRLGGEGRTAALGEGPLFPCAPDGTDCNLAAIAFVTPGVSVSGVYPPGFTGATPVGSIAGCDMRLVAAAARAGSPIGGWDIARESGKPNRRTIAPGSVYHFESASGSLEPGRLHGQALSDVDGTTFSRQGFGVVVAGVAG